MSTDSFFAHSAEGDKKSWQHLGEHLYNVASSAKDFAEAFGAGEWAYWAGLLHDVGKFSEKFQHHLETGKGRDDHATAGARLVKDLWTTRTAPDGTAGEILSTLLAYCIAGHHGGLPEMGATGDIPGTLRHRLSRKTIPDYSSWRDILSLPDTLPRLSLKSCTRKSFQFSLSFFVRMVYSCLTDADFLDTECFCDKRKAEARHGWVSIEKVVDAFRGTVAKLSTPPDAKDESPVNPARREILSHCLSAAPLTQGVFSLTVPTGGGKTLSSLAFALEHAKRNGLRRVIYVIPYTSIIEQNAQVFRDVLGEELAGRAILEHHSNYTHPREGELNADDHATARDAARFRLATENWSAPLVVTTAVQFFESLFANRSSQCRKLHNIAGSVVILDEAQMLPPELLQPTVAAIRELSLNYNVSVVLCTATQPALNKSGNLTMGFPAGRVCEIIPEEQKGRLFNEFRRSKVVQLGKCSDETLAERLKKHDQVLCIVNKRAHARALFNALGDGEGHFHLSARMYPAHRKRVLEAIRKRLYDGLACRVISTSLIECGVDVDFPIVYRCIPCAGRVGFHCPGSRTLQPGGAAAVRHCL